MRSLIKPGATEGFIFRRSAISLFIRDFKEAGFTEYLFEQNNSRTTQQKKPKNPNGPAAFYNSTWFPPGRSHTSRKILSTTLGLHNLMAKPF